RRVERSEEDLGRRGRRRLWRRGRSGREFGRERGRGRRGGSGNRSTARRHAGSAARSTHQSDERDEGDDDDREPLHADPHASTPGRVRGGEGAWSVVRQQATHDSTVTPGATLCFRWTVHTAHREGTAGPSLDALVVVGKSKMLSIEDGSDLNTLPVAMTGRASPAKAAVGDKPVFAYIA